MNKVTTLWFQKTLNSLRSCIPPSRTCMPIDGVWGCLVTKVLDCGPKQSMQKVTISFFKGSRQWLFLWLPLVFPRYYIFFMSGIAISALLLLVTSLAKVSRASPSIVQCLSLHWRKQKYCRLWSPVNDVASFWEQFNCQLTLMHSLKLRRDCHLE